MKKYAVVLAAILCGVFSLSAQDYDWNEFGYDDFEYDWGAEIEEPPDFVDPYAPAPSEAPPAPPQATPVPAVPEPAAPSSGAPAAAAPGEAESAAAETSFPETSFQETPFQEAQAFPESDAVEGAYYRVFSDSGDADAALLLKELELRLDFYNRLFRFDKERIAGPLQVRSIADAEAYETYVGSLLGQAPPGAVYIHYPRPEKRELVIHRGSDAEADMVAHQAFIQCLRAFIPDPPSWILAGFAIVFSSLRFDPLSETLVYDENLVWLDTVKKAGNGAAPPRLILLADTEEYARGSIDNFKALSWALASFFLNYDTENYFRALTEMFMVLSADASAAENSQAAVKRLTLWTDFDSLAGDYQNYLDAKKSFVELVEEGQEAYGRGDFETAGQCFAQARSMRPDHAVPCYYQGLLAYAAKDFAKAEELYDAALYNGADAALVRYALGLNAVSAGRSAEGIRWLEQAAADGPDRFGEKANAIINRLR
jgi:tetratricopeptide (TPR) repeat protein